MSNRFLVALSFLTLASPAFSHPGNHAGMGFIELVQHYAEADHLAFLALTVIVGIAAYRHGRRVEAKAQVTRKQVSPGNGGDRL